MRERDGKAMVWQGKNPLVSRGKGEKDGYFPLSSLSFSLRAILSVSSPDDGDDIAYSERD